MSWFVNKSLANDWAGERIWLDFLQASGGAGERGSGESPGENIWSLESQFSTEMQASGFFTKT